MQTTLHSSQAPLSGRALRCRAAASQVSSFPGCEEVGACHDSPLKEHRMLRPRSSLMLKPAAHLAGDVGVAA